MTAHRWLEQRVRPLIIAAMIGVVTHAIVTLLQTVVTGWNGGYLVAAAMLASLEAHYSHFLLAQRDLRGGERIRFRLIEVGILFVLVRVGLYAGRGWEPLWADIQRWPNEPLSFLMESEPLMAFVLAFLAWLKTLETIQDLEEVDLPAGLAEADPARRPDDAAAALLYPHLFLPRESLPLDNFVGRFLWGGVIVLVMGGLTRIGVAARLMDIPQRPVQENPWPIVLYFALGLVMMGLIRFAALRRQWWVEGLGVTGELVRRWVGYSVLLLGAAALLALLIPTYAAEGVLSSANLVIGTTLWGVYLVATVLLLIVILPFALLIWLLTSWMTGGSAPPLTPPMLPPPPPIVSEAVASTSAWDVLLRFLLFWGVVLLALFYLLRAYLRDHPELQAALLSFGPLRALLRLLRGMWRADGRLGARRGGAAAHHAAPASRHFHPRPPALDSPRRAFPARAGALLLSEHAAAGQAAGGGAAARPDARRVSGDAGGRGASRRRGDGAADAALCGGTL